MSLSGAPDPAPMALAPESPSAHTGDPSFSCKAATRVCQKGLLRRKRGGTEQAQSQLPQVPAAARQIRHPREGRRGKLAASCLQGRCWLGREGRG